jgi:general secretion pathway protein K
VAIIMVTVALVLMAAVGFEFSTRSTIDVMSAVNARDDMRAHFLARSGVNLAQLMIRVQGDFIDRAKNNMMPDIQLSDFAGMFMGAFGGSKEEVADVSALLGGFEGDAMKGLGAEIGEFDLAIAHEDGKINMNCANGSLRSKQALQAKLDALFFQEVYNPLFENPDGSGWRRDRQQQVSALIDYIDRDKTKYEAPGTPEEYGYQSDLADRYLAKDNYIDTVGELKLARGMDDRMWTLFGNQFTVYGDCQVNIGAVNDPRVVATIIYLAAKAPDDPVLTDPTGTKLLLLAQEVINAKNMGMTFSTLEDWANYVKAPTGGISQLMQMLNPGATPSPATAAVPVQGVELDLQKLQEIASVGPRRIYRVEVTATVGRVSKRLTAIWDQNAQNQNPRDPAYQKGTWVFWREE